MHSFDGKKYNIFFNGDFSGQIQFYDKESKTEVEIEGDDLVDFAKYIVGSKAIEAIEEALM